MKLSRDVCHRSHLKAYDVNGTGNDYLLARPRLCAAGVDDAAIHTITVGNPPRLLVGA